MAGVGTLVGGFILLVVVAVEVLVLSSSSYSMDMQIAPPPLPFFWSFSSFLIPFYYFSLGCRCVVVDKALLCHCLLVEKQRPAGAAA